MKTIASYDPLLNRKMLAIIIVIIAMFATFIAYLRNSKASAALTANSTLIEFGKVSEGEVRTSAFSLRNMSGETVNVDKIEADCGCTVPGVERLAISAGETGQIPIKYFAPEGAVGEVVRHILVKYHTSVSKKNILLSLHATIVSKTLIATVPGIIRFDGLSGNEVKFAVTGPLSLLSSLPANLQINCGESIKVPLKAAGSLDGPRCIKIIDLKTSTTFESKKGAVQIIDDSAKPLLVIPVEWEKVKDWIIQPSTVLISCMNGAVNYGDVHVRFSKFVPELKSVICSEFLTVEQIKSKTANYAEFHIQVREGRKIDNFQNVVQLQFAGTTGSVQVPVVVVEAGDQKDN